MTETFILFSFIIYCNLPILQHNWRHDRWEDDTAWVIVYTRILPGLVIELATIIRGSMNDTWTVLELTMNFKQKLELDIDYNGGPAMNELLIIGFNNGYFRRNLKSINKGVT